MVTYCSHVQLQAPPSHVSIYKKMKSVDVFLNLLHTRALNDKIQAGSVCVCGLKGGV